MSSEERDIILQMVAENKISTAEASDLLDALAETEAEETRPTSNEWYTASAGGDERDEHFSRHHRRDSRRFERDMHRMERDIERDVRDRLHHSRNHTGSGRSLLIHVRDGENTRTHVRIPLGMALAAGKFVPKKARVYLEQYGIDLSELMDSITNDFERIGDIVNIRDGETSVQVAVVGNETGRPTPPVNPIPPVPPVPPWPATPPENPSSDQTDVV